MSSIANPSWHEMNFVAPHHHLAQQGLNVDRLIYQMFALLGMIQGVAAGVIVAAPLPIVGEPIPEITIDIWGDRQLLGVCFLGSSLGTALRLTFFPMPELKALAGFTLVRALATKATVSMTCGLGVSPMLMRYMEWHPDGTNLVFASMAVAFLAEVTLSIATRAYQVWVEKKANEITGAKS